MGLADDVEPNVLPLGHIESGTNFVPVPSGLQAVRGGSRIMLTLHDDQGTPALVDHVCLLTPFTPVGAMAIAWSNFQNKHYLYRLTSDIAFASGVEATSRVDLTAAPSTSWDNGTLPARPVAAEMFEKLFLADATTDQTARNTFLSADSTGTILEPQFQFANGPAASLLPYCLEEYNSVLFLAGYGDEGDPDRPEMLRHSLLATSPDDANGFDPDAYLLLGAKGQRVTALRKGRGLLLAAKDHEFYRISGFGKSYPGWQYQVENVQNSTGLGISNPHALTFAEGFWYGIGAQGPIRTDGFNVESLAGPRQRGWRAMNQVQSAWVAYHPERHVVLFGMHPAQASAGRSTEYPWTVWVWDIERSVWQCDFTFGADLFMASPVTTSTAVGPSAAPSATSTDTETISGYTAHWTNGDASAQTEFWEQTGTGGWFLIATVAAGVTSYVRTGDQNHTLYLWKVRHRKSGVTTTYSADTTAKTLIAPPMLSVTCVKEGHDAVYTLINIDLNPGPCSMVIERLVGAVWTTQFTYGVSATGHYSFVGPNGQYRARSTDAAWPTPTSVNSTPITASC